MKVILVEVILYIIVIDSIEAIGRALVPYIETILDLSYVFCEHELQRASLSS